MSYFALELPLSGVFPTWTVSTRRAGSVSLVRCSIFSVGRVPRPEEVTLKVHRTEVRNQEIENDS